MLCVWREKRLEIHTERAGGRSESATVGVGIGIHDTEGITILFARTKAQQSYQIMGFGLQSGPPQLALTNYCQPLVVWSIANNFVNIKIQCHVLQ